ncbi:U-box domain-containing protein 4-like [Phragmites australis]|uniref:U-box domain-containing protein 4-like n=1 Tax=Phragmites australis TaxID=29695 RepID=UPI002D7760E0|nr:U-box domain-containing protein 4-like [Phragmites australis]XP_062192125.1 U-box domain-containing protein 4-like [Phragmites australis]
MENFSPTTLLNSISHLGVLTSDGLATRSKPIQKYCQNVYDISSIVKPLVEDLCKSPEEQLNEVLRELDTAINEASGLIGNWHQTTSKIYFGWQVESVISDIHGCSLQLCQLVNSLLPSLTGRACTCIEKLHVVNYELMFDFVKEIAMELTNTSAASPENLLKLSSTLSLSTNLELYMEAVSLENIRTRALRSENRKELDLAEQMIPLVNYMHERLLRDTQLLSINGVPIPADFCCPLSSELMSDPVIVASGQTYERVYIKLWLDEGFTICPKTRQRLGHSNLIPNYTVKALIANWCESHDIRLPDPMKSLKLNFPSAATSFQDLSAAGSSPLHSSAVSRANIPGSPETDGYLRNFNGASPPHSVVHQNSHVHVNRSGHEVSTSQSSENANGSAPDVSRLSLSSSEARESNLEGRRAGSIGQTSEQSTEEAFQSSNLDRDLQDNVASSSRNGSLPNSGQLDGECDNGVTRVPSDRMNYSSDASGEVTDGGAPVASSVPQREPSIPSRLGDVRTRGQFARRQASDRGFPRIISSSSMDARSDLSAIENQVRKLIEDLKSDSVDVQRSAASEIRLLAKHNMENRIVIANCGAVNLLVGLLHSPDAETQEHAVTALLNLSINDNNKIAIASADAVDPLIHVLETGNPEAKENSAATLFSLSVIEENKVRIGRSGAIKPLVDLLGNGTPRGKKDAATALFNLSILHENKARIVQADAVRHLVELMDPAAGMVDKAVAVLANLATIPEGRTAIGQARGIPALVEVVELGSARGKENAAAALLQLCTNSNRFCSIVLQEGAVPPLVALSQSGTPRAREKAQALLSYFRSQRHGNSARR